MNKSTFDNRPELISNEGDIVRINFDVESVVEKMPSISGEDVEREVYKAYVVRLTQPLDRDRIIDAIITAGYPNDKMQAVVNNYLLNPSDESIKSSFDEMQAWRVKAKQVADDVTSKNV